MSRGGWRLASIALVATLAMSPAAHAGWHQPVGGASPLNESSGMNVADPSLTAVGGVPHVSWQENDGVNTEIRVARLGAAGAAWEKVADSGSPINESPSENAGASSLADVGGVPYVAWNESDGFTNRVRVARLNGLGTAWEQVASPVGHSADPGANAAAPSLTSIGGVPYVAWTEFDFTNLEIRVARLNMAGTAWEQGPPWTGVSATSGGINQSNSAPGRDPSLTAIGGVPYVAWTETDSTPSTPNDELRVARLNGNAWEQPWTGVSATSGGINQSDSRNASGPSLTAIGGVPYVAWMENDGGNDEIRVARLNAAGTAWEQPWTGVSATSGGINESTDRNATNASLTAIGGVPYVSWRENDGVNDEIRVARLNGSGTGWEMVVDSPSPINESSTRNALQPSLASIGGFPHVAWSESDDINFELRVGRLEPEFLSRTATPTDTGATLSAEVRTFGLPYPVGFEYGGSLENETAPVPAPTGQGDEVPVSRQVGGLAPSSPYAFRPFATAGVAQPRVLGTVGTFATTAPPAGETPPPEDVPPPESPPAGAPPNDIAIGKAKLNVRRGTAKLPVAVPGVGGLELAGKGVKPVEKESPGAGTVNLKIAPKGKVERKLDADGKAKVTAEVTFTPTGGQPNTESAVVKLKKR